MSIRKKNLMINWEEDGEDVVEKKMKIVDGCGMDDEEKC